MTSTTISSTRTAMTMMLTRGTATTRNYKRDSTDDWKKINGEEEKRSNEKADDDKDKR